MSLSSFYQWGKYSNISRRQMAPLQGKVIRGSSPLDWNSKTRKVGQFREKAGLCPEHVFIILEVRRPPRPDMSRKGSLEAKQESCQGMFYPDTFSVKSTLAKRCMHTDERSWCEMKISPAILINKKCHSHQWFLVSKCELGLPKLWSSKCCHHSHLMVIAEELGWCKKQGEQGNRFGPR